MTCDVINTGLQRETNLMIEWQHLRTSEEVQQILEENLSGKASPEAIAVILREIGFQCSELTGQTIYCSISAESSLPFVRGKWLVELSFDEQKLISISVQKGLIGL